ncbi:MAG: Uma2 family endonuclease [Alkalinema sp. FL-bin-369]|nr:Uma2 family endonuclease [Leptolyngbyaceae cyanobacterium LF-bin-369]
MNSPVTSPAAIDLPPRPTPRQWKLKPLLLPTMYDLPSEDPKEPGLPDTFHGLQPQLLDEALWLPQYPDDQIFHAFDLNLYYNSNHTGWYKRLDWFLCVGVSSLYKGLVKRSSYVMWEEKVSPTVVIEFLSPGTEAEDLGRFASKTGRSSKSRKPLAKFVVYEEILKVPNYIVFDEKSQRLRFFRLVKGQYQEQSIEPENPRLWIPELNIGLGLKTCTVRKTTGSWLRWCDADGNFFPTPTESERVEKINAIAEAEAERAEKLAAIAEAEFERSEK